MSGRLAGKIAVVTAAGAGIGRATALAMAAEGAEIWATDRDAHLLADMPGVRAAALDMLDDGAIDAFFAGLARVDILFNCAGVVHDNGPLDATAAEWELAFALNVRAQWRAIRAALPGMIARGSGSIVNMASVCGATKGLPRRFVYGASKAAVVGLTKSVAAEHVADGVRCNAISPGTVESPSLQGRIAAQADPDAARAAFVARQPMGMIARPEDIAGLVVYLASDEARFVTGQNYVIDGGITI